MSTLKFIMNNQDTIKKIYDSALDSIEKEKIPVQNQLDERDSGHSVIYRGYKVMVSLKNERPFYELMTTFSSDYYKWVNKIDLEVFKDHGFKTACDILQVKRIQKKIRMYTNKIEGASKERNDSMMIHWQSRRRELVERKVKLEENLELSNYA